MTREYIRPTSLDIPAVGELYSARDGKKKYWKRIKELNQKIKDEPIGGNRVGLRLELMKVKDVHQQHLRNEKRALKNLEARANELGKTTIKNMAILNPDAPSDG